MLVVGWCVIPGAEFSPLFYPQLHYRQTCALQRTVIDLSHATLAN